MHTPRMNSQSRLGFTIIELLVVMGVILILAGIVIGVQSGVFAQQAEARAKGEMHAIASGLSGFKARYGDYPWIGTNANETLDDLFDTLTGRRYMTSNGSMANTSAGAPVFLEEQSIDTNNPNNPTRFVDPWGNEYRYFYKANANSDWNHTSFILVSAGPDGDISQDSLDDFANGDFPQNASDYYDADDPDHDDFDNIIYGLERN